jgi:hypothetical protein
MDKGFSMPLVFIANVGELIENWEKRKAIGGLEVECKFKERPIKVKKEKRFELGMRVYRLSQNLPRGGVPTMPSIFIAKPLRDASNGYS